MSVRRIKAGTTDVSVVIRIVDSTDGTPETGVVFNTSGIDLWYRRELAASVDITEATLAALTTAHADGGFLHINDGWYRLDLPDAACGTGVTGVQIGGTVTGMVVHAPYIELVAYDPYDTVRLGLTALPNAAADAAGGLPISDAGGLDLDAQIGTDIDAILVDTGTTLQAEVDGIQADTEDIQARLPAALGANGNIKADVRDYSGTAGTFSGGRPEVNVSHVGGSTTPVTNIGVVYNTDFATNYNTSADMWNVNVTNWRGTAVAIPTIAGVPEVDVTHWEGTTTLPGVFGAMFGSGTITADITGSLSGSVGSIGSGGISEASYATTAGTFAPLGIIDQGTAQSATSTTLVLRAASAFADDTLIGATVMVLGSTQGYWQAREIRDSVLSTDTVTVDAWTVTPSGTITYKILAAGPTVLGNLPHGGTAASLDVSNFVINSNFVVLGNTGFTGDLQVSGILTVSNNAIAWNSSWDAEVQSECADALTAFGASTLTQANIRTAVGLASANLDTQLDALPTAAEVATAVLTTAMTEAYRSAGATATLAQFAYEVLAHLGESSIASTTKTLKKLDGSTTAKTYTLNSATTPTSITETT